MAITRERLQELVAERLVVLDTQFGNNSFPNDYEKGRCTGRMEVLSYIKNTLDDPDVTLDGLSALCKDYKAQWEKTAEKVNRPFDKGYVQGRIEQYQLVLNRLEGNLNVEQSFEEIDKLRKDLSELQAMQGYYKKAGLEPERRSLDSAIEAISAKINAFEQEITRMA